MKFVALKMEEQQSMLILHRMSEQLIKMRTIRPRLRTIET